MSAATLKSAGSTARALPPCRASIRQATVDDLPRMLTGARKFFAEAKLPGTFRADIWLNAWESYMRLGMAVILIAEAGDTILGGIGGLFYNNPNTGDKVLTEAFWFVDPEHRGQGIKLLKSLENWAIQNQVAQMGICHFVHLNAEALNNLYLRLGFEPVEVFYRKCLTSS